LTKNTRTVSEKEKGRKKNGAGTTGRNSKAKDYYFY
jgi:hypothetical protein